MATSRPSTSTTDSSVKMIHELAELLRKNGHRVLNGDSKACFTSDSLISLNNYFRAAKINITLSTTNNNNIRTGSISIVQHSQTTPQLRISVKLREDLVFLSEFIQKIKIIKIIHNGPTLRGNVNLYPFGRITCLELKRIPPHMLIGLYQLREQLDTLICSQSVTKIKELICLCGPDPVEHQPWPQLKSLFLAHNLIESIDEALNHLPALELLDLSHNRLQECSNILEIIPHVQFLNLSSNHLSILPIWPKTKECKLQTLKMRQNCIEEIDDIESMKTIEELDLSDNFIVTIPDKMRQLLRIKRLYLARNPCTYAADYREKLIVNLPFIFSEEGRELLIDNEQLTSKEKQRIPRLRSVPVPLVPSFRTSLAASTTPPQSSSSSYITSSDPSTDPESVTTNTSGTVVTRRKTSRTRRKVRDSHPQPVDSDDTPTENVAFGTNNEIRTHRNHLGKSDQHRQEGENNSVQPHSLLFVGHVAPPTIIENEESLSRSVSSLLVPSGISRKLANDLSSSPRRRKSPRSRKSDIPAKLVFEEVHASNTLSDVGPMPDSPISEKEIQFNDDDKRIKTQSPIEFLTEHLSAGDSIRTIFFVTAQRSGDNNKRSLTVEIDRMYLIEKDNDENYVEKFKYSTIKLSTNSESDEKTVRITFEKQRGDIEDRIYLFDTIQDQKAFVEEIERHLGSSQPIDVQTIASINRECNKCGKIISPQINTMNNIGNLSSSTCVNCLNITPTASPQLEIELQVNVSDDIFSDAVELDHRLHFHLATEHFTHNNEHIKLHFKCFVVHSTASKHFIAQTIITDYGIYIFQQELPKSNVEEEYVLVGKDLLTNVLMLDVGYRLQTFTIELQSAAFAFLLADQEKTQRIINSILEVLSPFVQNGESALQKISRISSDEYRQRLFDIIKVECNIDEPSDDLIDFYSIVIRIDATGTSQMIALLLLRNWVLMIEDAYATIGSRHVRLPALPSSDNGVNQQLKCDLMHLVNVASYLNSSKQLIFDFVDESETKQFRWKLESLTSDSKNEFLRKIRDSYKKFMAISMPETLEMA